MSSESGSTAKAFHSTDLQIWQKGVYLAKAVYQLTAPFQPQEKYGLASQMRRAVVLIPSDIGGAGASWQQ